MSLKNDLKLSLENQDEQDDEILESIKELNLLTPRIEERKREREAKRTLINNAPEEFIEEYGFKLLQIERDDEKKLRYYLSPFTSSVDNVIKVVNSTSGSTSAYIAEAVGYIRVDEESGRLLEPAIKSFEELANYKSQKTDIPKDLDDLYPGLGSMFLEAVQSAEKAKNGLENKSNAIMAMRNFLQKSFWGNLLQLALALDPPTWQGFQKRKLKQSDTRDLVAKSLSDNQADERKLVEYFQIMDDLSDDLSNSEVGKNLLFDDQDLLNSLFAEWFLLIDDVVKITLPKKQ